MQYIEKKILTVAVRIVPVKNMEENKEAINKELHNIRSQLKRPGLSGTFRFFAIISRLRSKLQKKAILTPGDELREYNPGKIILDSVEKTQNLFDRLFILDSAHVSTIWSAIADARKKGKTIVVIMAPGYKTEDLKDGYYRRIKAIDDLYSESSLRIYISSKDADWKNQSLKVELLQAEQIDLRYCLGFQPHEVLIKEIISKSDVLYHHSIAYLNASFLSVQGVVKVLDAHGAVPEELCLYGLDAEADLSAQNERLAFEKMDLVVTVSENMRRHFINKYPETKVSFITLPIGFESIGNIRLMKRALTTNLRSFTLVACKNGKALI